MTWTYTNDPSVVARDKVRFLIGDTDTANQLITDEEIAFLLAEWNNDGYVSAARGCDALAARFAAKSDQSKSVGDLSLTTHYGEQATRYMALGAALLDQASANKPPSPSVYLDADGFVGHESKFYIDMGKFA